MTAKAPSAEAIKSPLFTLVQVCEHMSLDKTSVYNLVKSGRFPKPVLLLPYASRWVRADVEAWVEARIREAAEGLKPYSTPDKAIVSAEAA